MSKVYVSNPAQLECRSHLVEYAAKQHLPDLGLVVKNTSIFLKLTPMDSIQCRPYGALTLRKQHIYTDTAPLGLQLPETDELLFL